MMVHCCETGSKDTPDVFYILERKGCLSKLPIGYLCINHLIHSLGDGSFGEIFEASRTGFYSICHHEDCTFFGRRFGSRVAEGGVIDLLFGMRVTPCVIEIPREGSSMMGGNKIDDHFRQIIASSNLLTLRDMRYNHLCRIAGVHREEGILDSCLVLHEIERIGHFADIMIECSGTNEEGIGTDSLRSFGSEVGDLHGVLESTGCTLRQGMEEIGIDIRELDEGDRRDETECFLKHIYQSVTTDRKQSANEEI